MRESKRRRSILKTGLLLFLALGIGAAGTGRASAEVPASCEVSWKAYFTDISHQIELAAPRSGTVPGGTEVYLGFPGSITAGGEIWETAEIPGPRVVRGPGTDIFYIEYRKVGDAPVPEDSDKAAKQLLADRIRKAKEAESDLTGKDVAQISDSSVFCDSDGDVRLRLVSAAGFLADAGSHDVYVIAKNMSPTGICLKEAFGAGIIYSNEVMEEIGIGENIYRVYRFGIQKVYGDTCPHKFEITVSAEPTCIKRGTLRYKCTLCGEERTVYRPPAGHTDADSDGICDICLMDAAAPAKEIHWYVGDTISEAVGGKNCIFRCIDEDYVDYEQNHTHAALFLCDSVLPAGTGGEYREEVDGTGHTVKKWYPGPIAEFGTTNSYKKSKIRAFLDSVEPRIAVTAAIGVATSCTGETEKGKFSQLSDKSLTGYRIGYQLMEAKLFCLSLEEAVKYRQYLWRFGGSCTDNPAAAANGTCTGYWLRTPFGNAASYDETDMEYVVDLVTGNIHPANIHPEAATGDPYIDTQTTYGVRPAFLIKND